jgi:hypothetical protein
VISDGVRRALGFLSGSPGGRTLANMRAQGFTDAALDRLVREGLAVIKPETMSADTRRVTVVWITLTDAGRRAIA